MVCLQLYVSGIDKKATEYQVYSFFKSISDDVTGVLLIENKTYEGQQKAIVYFSRQNTINYVIKTINYQVIDGWILKCNHTLEMIFQLTNQKLLFNFQLTMI